MLDTKCVGDNLKMLVTVLVGHQHPKDVNKILILLPTF